ncbi:MAG: hypothetical protein ACRCT1_10755 [Microcoleaceae cyanobacterium]
MSARSRSFSETGFLEISDLSEKSLSRNPVSWGKSAIALFFPLSLIPFKPHKVGQASCRAQARCLCYWNVKWVTAYLPFG